MRYPFVLLDAGGTLFSVRGSMGAVYARVLGEHGLRRPVEDLDAALERAWGELDRTVPRGVDRYGHFPDGESGFWLRFARTALENLLGAAPPDGFVEKVLDPLRDAFREPSVWRVFPDVPPALDTLERLGARLAVVSNWDSRLPALLERIGLAGRFRSVVVSHLVGVEKPDPALFRHALADLGARAEEAIHVGDVPELDGDGAAAAGISSVLVDRRGVLDPSFEALEDLTRLPEIVRNGFG